MKYWCSGGTYRKMIRSEENRTERTERTEEKKQKILLVVDRSINQRVPVQ